MAQAVAQRLRVSVLLTEWEGGAQGFLPFLPVSWWPDPEKVDRRKLQFCPIRRSRTNEEKSIQ